MNGKGALAFKQIPVTAAADPNTSSADGARHADAAAKTKQAGYHVREGRCSGRGQLV
jgi:hypothetical protein